MQTRQRRRNLFLEDDWNVNKWIVWAVGSWISVSKQLFASFFWGEECDCTFSGKYTSSDLSCNHAVAWDLVKQWRSSVNWRRCTIIISELNPNSNQISDHVPSLIPILPTPCHAKHSTILCMDICLAGVTRHYFIFFNGKKRRKPCHFSMRCMEMLR